MLAASAWRNSAAWRWRTRSSQRGAARAHRGARAYQQTWRLLALAGARALFRRLLSGASAMAASISGIMAKSINKRIEENINVVAAWPASASAKSTIS
jgi:hypothetical protein